VNIIYERIDELCKEKGTTYNAVCKAVGIRSSLIGNLKSRETSVPKADTISLLANYFNVPVDYILGITDDRGDKKRTATIGDGNDELSIAVSKANERQRELILRILNMPEDQQNAFLSIAQSLHTDQ